MIILEKQICLIVYLCRSLIRLDRIAVGSISVLEDSPIAPPQLRTGLVQA